MDTRRRVGVAAVEAGSLFFLGQGGELVFGDDGRVVLVVLVACLGVAILAFGVAFHGLRGLLVGPAGRTGATIGLAGVGFLVAFAAQLSVAAATTGEVPENFLLFAIGFGLLLLRQPARVGVGAT